MITIMMISTPAQSSPRPRCQKTWGGVSGIPRGLFPSLVLSTRPEAPSIVNPTRTLKAPSRFSSKMQARWTRSRWKAHCQSLFSHLSPCSSSRSSSASSFSSCTRRQTRSQWRWWARWRSLRWCPPSPRSWGPLSELLKIQVFNVLVLNDGGCSLPLHSS